MIYQKTANQRRPRDCVKKYELRCVKVIELGASSLTIWGRSRESLPMVLKTRSWSLLTIPSKSSPREAIVMSKCPKGPSVDALRKVVGLRVGNRASSSRFGVLSLSQIYCCSVTRPQQTQQKKKGKALIVIRLMRCELRRMFTSPTYKFWPCQVYGKSRQGFCQKCKA
jgi:hypothetical protein